MSVQVFLYHDRLQKDVNSLTDLVQELREWKASKEERRKSLDEKLDQAVGRGVKYHHGRSAAWGYSGAVRGAVRA
ncbi:hypothetical protein MHFGQ_09380 [Moorella humiferrea]|uniref:Uncharacterized protein n=2 Tax=Neomoorella humiferrea TaxID=676965 RepID=A0A2T0AKW1_9FIRM|nr:hypothetical protein MOHU_25100 [Moorella humiferrea]